LCLSDYSFKLIPFGYLNNIQLLVLCHCPDMIALGELKNIRELKILNMPELTDISSIKSLNGYILRVSIDHCPKLSQVSSLFGISDVLIAFCPLVLDVSTLGNHRSFVFYNSHYICSDISHLHGVVNPTLHCRSFQCELSMVQNITGKISLSVNPRYNHDSIRLLLSYFEGTELNFSYLNIPELKVFHNCSNLRILTLVNCEMDMYEFQHDILPSLPTVYL
jgi:hypothetical protein